jgi:hypothetical protein
VGSPKGMVLRPKEMVLHGGCVEAREEEEEER